MNFFNEMDFLDIETKGKVKLAAQRWREMTKASCEAARREHAKFIFIVYIAAFLVLAVVIGEWVLISMKFTWSVKILKAHSFLVPSLSFVNFLMAATIPIVLHQKIEKPKWMIIAYMVVLFELSSTMMIWPLTQLYVHEFLRGIALTAAVVGITLIVALCYHFDMDQDGSYLITWTIRYFLTTAIALLLTLAMENKYLATCISVMLVFFITIYSIIFARSLASGLFYREESPYLLLYITLAYLIFLSHVANSLVFFHMFEMIAFTF